MKKLAVFAVAAVLAASAFAQATWVGNSTIIWNGNETPSAQWTDMGTINSLLLGGTLQIAANGADWQSGAGDWMHYTIDKNDSAWKDIELAYDSYGYGEYNNNMLFKNTSDANVDISSYKDDGQTHTVSVYFGGVDGNYDSNNGDNYVANFKATSAVPEPATMSLLGLGALAMALRRKLRK